MKHAFIIENKKHCVLVAYRMIPHKKSRSARVQSSCLARASTLSRQLGSMDSWALERERERVCVTGAWNVRSSRHRQLVRRRRRELCKNVGNSENGRRSLAFCLAGGLISIEIRFDRHR
jgi:hypothetical protein